LEALVHSFQNNTAWSDYGPTIILEHSLSNQRFFTLYGHLSLESLEGLYEGKRIEKGEKIAEFGNYPINGDWSPHLHFQIILDLLGKKGDFFGVCTPQEQEVFAKICPNPNLILRSELLFS
jgi:murein DD-endopeptidase MepM/ murein hydrolase activator NlpD